MTFSFAQQFHFHFIVTRFFHSLVAAETFKYVREPFSRFVNRNFFIAHILIDAMRYVCEREYKISFGWFCTFYFYSFFFADYVKQWKLNTCENDLMQHICVKCLEKFFHHDFGKKKCRKKKKRKMKLRNYNAIKILSLRLSCARWPSFLLFSNMSMKMFWHESITVETWPVKHTSALSIEKFSWRRRLCLFWPMYIA